MNARAIFRRGDIVRLDGEIRSALIHGVLRDGRLICSCVDTGRGFQIPADHAAQIDPANVIEGLTIDKPLSGLVVVNE